MDAAPAVIALHTDRSIESTRATLTSYLITFITDTLDSKAQKAYAPPPYSQIIPAPSHKRPPICGTVTLSGPADGKSGFESLKLAFRR